MAVERGDLIGLVVIEGSGVGTRRRDGAATERWLPHVGVARQPSFASGRGFEREVLLRAELVPGAKVRPPKAWVGESVKRLPPGRVLERRRLTLPNGHLVEIDVVQVGRRVVIDYRNREALIARMDLPGFNPGGVVVLLSVDPSTGPDGVDVYVEYVGLNSQRVRNHYYGVDMNGFVFVD
jgi:hypothetical protein